MLIELYQHLAIAAITNHTLIIPTLLYVHHENEEDWANGAKMNQLLDLSILADHYSIITFDDYSAAHGNITVSHVYNFHCETGGCHEPEGQLWWMARYRGEANFTEAPFVEVPTKQGLPQCSSADDVARLVRVMTGGPVIGVTGIPFGLRNSLEGFSCGDLDVESVCCRTITDVYSKTRHSQLVRDWASAFISTSFSDSEYLGMHVRPFQDNCLEVWRDKPMFKDEDVASICVNPNLQNSMLTAASTAMDEFKLQHVFVASHPAIRAPNIIPRLKTIGIHPTFVTFKFVEDRMRRLDIIQTRTEIENMPKNDSSLVVLYLLLVEQEIMQRSKVFFGSQDSTITGLVRNSRAARGVHTHDSLMF